MITTLTTRWWLSINPPGSMLSSSCSLSLMSFSSPLSRPPSSSTLTEKLAPKLFCSIKSSSNIRSSCHSCLWGRIISTSQPRNLSRFFCMSTGTKSDTSTILLKFVSRSTCITKGLFKSANTCNCARFYSQTAP